jgi:PAS domain S-box-containing protein
MMMTSPAALSAPQTGNSFEFIVEGAPSAIVVVDQADRIIVVNRSAESLFGYRREELIGEPFEILAPKSVDDSREEPAAGFPAIEQGHSSAARSDLLGARKDGTAVRLAIDLNPIDTPAGRITVATIADVTERRRAEALQQRLTAQLCRLNTELETRVSARTAELREREAMLQEIHHRVKNNLQVISSLISMQVRTLTDEPTRLALRQCQARVATMAQIHEMLYQSTDYARVPFGKFIKDLTARILSASGLTPSSITLHFELEEVSLGMNKAIPCGLILNELIANCLKHAFPDAAQGEIRVGLRRLGNETILLSVSDNGVGMPSGFDWDQSSSLGVHLVRALAKQLDGRVEAVREPGTTYRIIFAEAAPS